MTASFGQELHIQVGAGTIGVITSDISASGCDTLALQIQILEADLLVVSHEGRLGSIVAQNSNASATSKAVGSFLPHVVFVLGGVKVLGLRDR